MLEGSDELNKKFDELQSVYGAEDLCSVYGCGCEHQPKVALVFMNPTKRNIATQKTWRGLRAQWLGTKQIWDFLVKCRLFSAELCEEVKSKRPEKWNAEFCRRVYDEVKLQGVWMTNLAKCTQEDARPLPDKVFFAIC